MEETFLVGSNDPASPLKSGLNHCPEPETVLNRANAFNHRQRLEVGAWDRPPYSEGNVKESPIHDDRAGEAYWDSVWQEPELPRPFDSRDNSLRNHSRIQFHRFFSRIFQDRQTSARRLIEIGCARSLLLPYFGQIHGLQVVGLDYSPLGCDLARRLLESAGLEPEIYCSNLFDPPENLLGSFDFVFTNGVVEHFSDTSGVFKALARLSRPGGTLITIIPNMRGLTGLLQRVVNKSVYRVHVPLGVNDLTLAQRNARLDVKECEYFQNLNLGVVNMGSAHEHFPTALLRKLVRLSLDLSTAGFWTFERLNLVRLKPTQYRSPYVVSVAQKPEAAESG